MCMNHADSLCVGNNVGHPQSPEQRVCAGSEANVAIVDRTLNRPGPIVCCEGWQRTQAEGWAPARVGAKD